MMSDWNDAADNDLLACPACGGELSLPEEPILGEVIWCDACGAELEVVSLNPLRIALFEEEEK